MNLGYGTTRSSASENFGDTGKLRRGFLLVKGLPFEVLKKGKKKDPDYIQRNEISVKEHELQYHD